MLSAGVGQAWALNAVWMLQQQSVAEQRAELALTKALSWCMLLLGSAVLTAECLAASAD